MASIPMNADGGISPRDANQPFATHGGKSVQRLPVQQPPLRAPALSLVAAPLFIFVATSIAFAVLWQAMPLPAVLAMVFLLAALPMSMPVAHIKAGAVAAGALLPIGVCLLALVSGALTGIYAYEAYLHPFFAMSLGRTYHNVLASTPGAAYADAGKVHFADSSDVQVDFALGYRRAPTYCVAPIMDSSSGGLQARMITFWAIGTNCCTARGTFTCAKQEARGGVRATLDGIFVQSHQEFLKAIAQAAAVSDLAVDDNPILVHWVADPAAEQRDKLLGAFGVLGLGTALFALVALGALAVNALQKLGAASSPRSRQLPPSRQLA